MNGLWKTHAWMMSDNVDMILVRRGYQCVVHGMMIYAIITDIKLGKFSVTSAWQV